jgi:hypothetical protein
MMKRFSFLLTALLCYSFSFGQSITRSATIASQSGNVAWAAPATISEAIISNDGRYLKSDLEPNQPSGILNLTGFAFNVPINASISGIVVTIKRHAGFGQLTDKVIRLIQASAQTGENKASGSNWSINDVSWKYGATNDKWGIAVLSPSQVNSPGFGISIQVQNGSVPASAFIDQVSITIYYAASQQFPVRFVSFVSKKENAGMQLTWKVHEEDRLLRYEIERGSDGIKFEKIAIVPAKANEEYSYIDLHPLTGKSFYRIKGVDIDSKYGYSPVLSFNAGKAGVVFKAFPTVVQTQLTVQHDAAAADTRIIISDQDGKIIRNITPFKGSTETLVELSSIGHGIYVLKYTGDNGMGETLKFLKQ